MRGGREAALPRATTRLAEVAAEGLPRVEAHGRRGEGGTRSEAAHLGRGNGGARQGRRRGHCTGQRTSPHTTHLQRRDCKRSIAAVAQVLGGVERPVRSDDVRGGEQAAGQARGLLLRRSCWRRGGPRSSECRHRRGRDSEEEGRRGERRPRRVVYDRAGHGARRRVAHEGKGRGGGDRERGVAGADGNLRSRPRPSRRGSDLHRVGRRGGRTRVCCRASGRHERQVRQARVAVRREGERDACGRRWGGSCSSAHCDGAARGGPGWGVTARRSHARKTARSLARMKADAAPRHEVPAPPYPEPTRP